MQPHTLLAAIGVAFLASGFALARRFVPPNPWYGVRFTATFADSYVWYETNATAGRDFMALGAVLLAVTFALPPVAALSPAEYAAVCGGVAVVGSGACIARARRQANRLLQERRAGRAGRAGGAA